jgi:ABC-type polysaccharide/polyol phosphate transport system ATPase subunit
VALSTTVEPPAQERAAVLAAASPAVTIEHVRKTFRIPHRRYGTLKERALHPFQSRTFDDLKALDDVSVTIPQGEFFGIVGRNGSGKSTLLKCLAEIYRPDTGTIDVVGRLSPFIELGVGFNPELTARDNVIINAVMMGLTRREARERFDDIVAFAELEDFVDLKLKNYSSGMGVRLAFSVAVHVEADVLLVDEVLAVGDAAFQQKCFDEFSRLRAEGRTIILVTHDMGAVERFCDRALLLERGRIVAIGGPTEIAREYNELNFGQLVHAEVEGDRQGDHTACEIEAAWFERRGERVTSVAQGEPLTIVMQTRFHDELDDPVFAVTLRNEVGHTIFSTSTAWKSVDTGRFARGELATIRIDLDTWFATSHYRLTPSVGRAGAGPGARVNALDLREDLVSLFVHSTRATGGVVDVPHAIEVERG